jgi:hypothetical protein
VAVAVQADFVAGVADHGAFVREGFEAVARDEPGGFDVVFFEEFEEATGAVRAGEETCEEEKGDELLEYVGKRGLESRFHDREM